MTRTPEPALRPGPNMPAAQDRAPLSGPGTTATPGVAPWGLVVVGAPESRGMSVVAGVTVWASWYSLWPYAESTDARRATLSA